MKTGAMFWTIAGLLLTGFVIGSLGRLLVPGPNPMGLPTTVAVGVGGAIIGGLLGNVVGPGLTILGAIAGAALLVWILERVQTPSQPSE